MGAVEMLTEKGGFGLTQALLVYSDERKTPAYVSVHDVAIQESGPPVIQAGKPVSKNGLIAMLQNLAPQVYPKPSLLDPKILAAGPGCLVWYVEPKKRQVWFKCEQLGEISANVPLPGLVFMVSPDGWYVFALKDAGRPTPETNLYVSPFFNVWEGGKICTGNVTLPSAEFFNSTDAWEDAFFRSYFTHPNIQIPKQLTLARGGSYKLWERLLKGKARVFPLASLVPTKTSLSRKFKQVFEGGY